MNLRIIKKQCKQAMAVLIAEYGYKPCDFQPADGEEAIYAPCGMEKRYERNGFLEPGPLPGTPILWKKASYEYDEWDAYLPSEELRDIIHWSHFRLSKEDIAGWDAWAEEQNRLLAEGRHPFARQCGQSSAVEPFANSVGGSGSTPDGRSHLHENREATDR